MDVIEKRPHFNPKKIDAFDINFFSLHTPNISLEDEFIPATTKRLHFFKIESVDRVYLTISKPAKDKLDSLYRSRTLIPGLNTFTKNYYNACLTMISMISYFTMVRKEEFVPIAFQNFRKIHIHYIGLVRFLKKHGIIETIDYTFTTKIHQIYRNSVTKYKILGANDVLEAKVPPTQTFNDAKLVKNLIKLNKKFLDYKDVNHGNYDAFTFHQKDFPAVNQILQEDYSKKRQMALSEYKRDVKKQKDGVVEPLRNRLRKIQTVLYTMIRDIHNIMNGIATISVDEFGYRKHSEYTRIMKSIRKLLTHVNSPRDYNDVAEVDLKSSQISFLVHMLPGYFEDAYAPLLRDNPDLYEKKKARLTKDVKFCETLLKTGEFYKYFTEEMGKLGTKVTQKETKLITIAYLFSQSNQARYVIHKNTKVADAFIKVFETQFKEFTIILRKMKVKDHKRLAQTLQRAESKFMETVSKILTDFKVDKVMIHDSFLVPSNKVQTTENIIKNVIESLKLPMTITTSVTELTGYKRSKVYDSFKGMTKRQEIIKELVKTHSYGSSEFIKFKGVINTSEIMKEEKTPKNSILRKEEFKRGLKATRASRRQTREKRNQTGNISSLVLSRNLTILKGYLFLRTRNDFIMELEKDPELLMLYTDNRIHQSLLTRFETTAENLDETMVDILNLEPTLGIYRELEGDELKSHEARLHFNKKYRRNPTFVPKKNGKSKETVVKSVNENKVQENNISKPDELWELGYGTESGNRVKSNRRKERKREIDLDGGDQLWFLQ